MGTPDTLVPRLIACGVSPLDLRGCSDADIARVAAVAGGPLPATYAQFLSLVGRGAGEFMSDLTAFYPDILPLTGARRAAMGGVLPTDGFVVADRYGEQVAFVRLSDGPAYRWSDERPRKARKVFDSVGRSWRTSRVGTRGSRVRQTSRGGHCSSMPSRSTPFTSSRATPCRRATSSREEGSSSPSSVVTRPTGTAAERAALARAHWGSGTTCAGYWTWPSARTRGGPGSQHRGRLGIRPAGGRAPAEGGDGQGEHPHPTADGRPG